MVFESVSKVYPVKKRSGAAPVQALANISLELPAGQITGVIGRSGAGKSTLLRTVNLLERPTSGRILLDGEDITKVQGNALRSVRRRIGMVFQHFSLMSSKTVWENVRLPLLLAGVDESVADRRVAELLELVGLEHRASAYPAQLSGGQKQRVGIARALVQEPEILLSDEATSALDPETTRSILDLMRTINRERAVTILLITHEMGVIQEICDQVAVIDGGQIVEHGPVWQVFSKPEHPTTLSLLESFRRSSPREIARSLASLHHPEVVQGVDNQHSRNLILRFDGTRSINVSQIGETLRSASGEPLRLLASNITPVQGHPQGHLVLALPEGEAGAAIQARALMIADSIEVI